MLVPYNHAQNQLDTEKTMNLTMVNSSGLPIKRVELQRRGKFVVCKKYDVFLITFFVSGIYHIDVAEKLVNKNRKFIAAGNYKHGYQGDPAEVSFDSDTCRESFGYYKPADEKLAQEILDAIAKLVS